MITKEAYREGGIPIFFRGLGICSARAFVVNAVQVCHNSIPDGVERTDEASGLYMSGLSVL